MIKGLKENPFHRCLRKVFLLDNTINFFLSNPKFSLFVSYLKFNATEPVKHGSKVKNRRRLLQ